MHRVALMLVAAFGFLPALLGAWMQELVDLVAILGALRAIGPRGERSARSRTIPGSVASPAMAAPSSRVGVASSNSLESKHQNRERE